MDQLPIQCVFPPHSHRSWDGLQIHHDADWDEALTEDDKGLGIIIDLV